ncbi:rRNA maturation RNase YbeY [Candidatus Neomarinimicrobiota bacterium]
MIVVSIDSQSGEPPPLPSEVVISLVRSALTNIDINAGQVQVVFTDDEYLRRLKQEFFDQNDYTDVIVFNLNEADEPLEGEIYISMDRALENSLLYKEGYSRELMRLVIHGCLHLSGCEDDTPEAQANMRALEERFLASAPELQNNERHTH